MWCEFVMVPPAAVYHQNGGNAPLGTNAVSNLSPLPFSVYPSIPALTGIPLNKTSQPALPNAPNSAAQQQKLDTTNHYHVFVGDLAPEIESHHLKEAFYQFGIVTECKIIKDMHTQKPKGYGFVAYATKEEADKAIQKMNGQLLGSRTIRTNWAVRKPPQPPGKEQKPLNYDEVFSAASISNCTVYVGGISTGLCEELIRHAFHDFGDIQEVRVFKEKGYAFVRFDSHIVATKAIISMHGKDVGGQPCKCSWGKECNETKENSITEALLSPLSSYYTQLSALNYLQQQQQPLSLSGYGNMSAANGIYTGGNPMNSFGLSTPVGPSLATGFSAAAAAAVAANCALTTNGSSPLTAAFQHVQ